MKHVYPLRHPPAFDAPQREAPGATTAGPALPHERDESSRGQAQATPQQREIGREAYHDATDGTADTDKGPVMDKVYNEKVAPERGSAKPRR